MRTNSVDELDGGARSRGRRDGNGRRRARALAAAAATVTAAAAVCFLGSSVPALAAAQWSAPAQIDAGNAITSVSCPTSSFCAAVDASGNAATFNGASWTAFSQVDSTNDITSVSCPTSGFCAAVDSVGNAVMFDGILWTSFGQIDSTNNITSVSCPTSSFCAAVDAAGNADTFNGIGWAGAASIDSTNPLTSVSCPTSSFCAAVDSVGNAGALNGTWSFAPVDASEHLTSVSCATSTFCAAVDAGGNALTFNGSQWTVIASVDPTALNAVSCADATNCIAVDTAGSALKWATVPVPVDSAPPTITGTAAQGDALSEHHGTWTNGPSPNGFAIQWLQCDSAGAGCNPISGQTGSTYTLKPGDVNHTIRVQETASNGGGTSAPAQSAPTAVVFPGPPVNETAPTISGTAAQGDRLTEHAGTWFSLTPASVALQWDRCDGAGAGCTPIAGATGSTYTLGAADVAHTIRVKETASNAGGAGNPASSPASAVVVGTGSPSGSVPTNTAAPTISGTAAPGVVLTEGHGSWTGNPTTFALQWQRCDGAGARCAPIAGETRSSYTVRPGDVGHAIRVQETAGNAAGSGTPATSSATAAVAAHLVAGLASALARDLGPSGMTASLSALLRAGSLALAVSSPEPGSVAVRWVDGVPSATARTAAARSTVLAAGSQRITAGKASTLRLVLTAAGKRFLATSRGRAKITAQGTFTPKGARPVTASRTLEIGHVRPRGSQIGVYRIPTPHSGPTGIALGPRSTVWFTEWNVGKVARASASGRVTEFPISSQAKPWGLTAGPGGVIWFADRGTNAIGEITVAGHVVEDPLHTPAPADPTSIAAGPAGTMRFTETAAGAIGSIDTRTHAITSTPLPKGAGAPVDLVSDAARNSFFDDIGGHAHALQIGEITANGRITTHTLAKGSRYGAYPGSIGLGRNGAGQEIVYTLDDGNHAVVAYNPTTKTVRYFSYPRGSQFAQGLTVAADGSVWYTLQKAGTVDRLDPATGVTTTYSTRPATVEPDGIIQGADGSLWFLDWMNDAVYRVASGQCPVSLCFATKP